MKEALIIFVKNPEKGKVKTRLASTIGDEKALKAYYYLLDHTDKVVKDLSKDIYVFFSERVDNELFGSAVGKHVQKKDGLGMKMLDAFYQIKHLGYHKIGIIGSDCIELRKAHIEQAFEALDSYDVVLGPAKDGGYYFLGMKVVNEVFFKDKKWSTNTVYSDTVTNCESLNLSHYSLPILSDVDVENDLGELKEKL